MNLNKNIRFCLLLFFFANPLFAVDYFQFEPLNGDFVFGGWSDNGSVSLAQVNCIASASTLHPQGNGGTNSPYSVKVDNLIGSGGYYLYLDGDASNTGSSRIEVDIKHSDIKVSSSAVSLQEGAGYISDSHSHNGQFKNCVQGVNSQIEVIIPDTELSPAVSGNYSGSFRYSAIGGESGTLDNYDDFTVSISVSGGSQVRITSVDNIDLGNYSYNGDVLANERFCVYSQTGSYTISVDSPNLDENADFNLYDPVSESTLGYQLSFIDSGSGQGNTVLSDIPVTGTGDNSSETCSGIDNATLTISIDEQNLDASLSGNYSDTITILIQPN